MLAGTVLTALVAFYIFPFGWSFNLAMTFGSILSATDPVAVAALMEELGAPPRLKVHIVRNEMIVCHCFCVNISKAHGSYCYRIAIDGWILIDYSEWGSTA